MNKLKAKHLPGGGKFRIINILGTHYESIKALAAKDNVSMAYWLRLVISKELMRHGVVTDVSEPAPMTEENPLDPLSKELDEESSEYMSIDEAEKIQPPDGSPGLLQ